MAILTSRFKFEPDSSVPTTGLKGQSFQNSEDAHTRLLLVCDYPCDEDFEHGVVLDGPQRDVLVNAIEYVTKHTNLNFKEISVIDWAHANEPAIRKQAAENNLSNDKTLARIEDYNNARVLGFIKKMKPDIVMFSGMSAFKSFVWKYAKDQFPYSKQEQIDKKFNRLITIKIGGQSIKVIGTVDLRRVGSQLHKEIKLYTNLAGFFVRALETALVQKNRYTIKFDFDNANYSYLNTIEKFDKFYKLLISKANDVVSIDSETRSLAVIKNKLYSIQFAFKSDLDEGRNRAFFLPIEHPKTPFSADELDHIRSKLKHYFERGKSKYLVLQNAKFDLKQFIAQLGVTYFNHRIYDVMAGEYALDENRKLLQKKGGIGALDKPYSLDSIAEQYGSDIYSTIPFSKGDRGNIGDMKLTKSLIKYGCIDVILPLLIIERQKREAKRQNNPHFMKFLLGQMSDTHLAITNLEHTGAPLDLKYLADIRQDGSAIERELQSIIKEMDALPNVKKANARLMSLKNVPQGFREHKVFSIRKPEHRQVLFFDVMNLQPLGVTAGGKPSVSKAFKNKYEAVKEVKYIKDYDETYKLRSTYIDPFYTRLVSDPDCDDHSIRCYYSWEDVVTGRLSSRDPNLQNISEHGRTAYIIKRAFVSKPGFIAGKNDFNAHEVKCWAVLSRDENLTTAFNKGAAMRIKMRLMYMKDPDAADMWQQIMKDSNWKKLKTTQEKEAVIAKINSPYVKDIANLQLELEQFGDIHKINANLFFGTPILEITDAQRQSVKAVIFGSIYGKTAAGLAETLNISVEDAQELLNQLFRAFKQGGEWLKSSIKGARETFKVVSPVGMVRHLWAYLHNKPGVHNAMDRRGPNSIIQGLASQLGVSSMRILQDLCWNFLTSKNKKADWRISTNYVHDALEWTSEFHLLPLKLYMVEHASTTLLHEKFTNEYDMEFGAPLELEFKLGPSMDALKKWSWGPNELLKLVEETMDWQENNFNVSFNQKEIMKALKHNLDIIMPLRQKELQELDKAGDTVARKMLLTGKHVDAMIFDVETFKSVKRARSKEELRLELKIKHDVNSHQAA